MIPYLLSPLILFKLTASFNDFKVIFKSLMGQHRDNSSPNRPTPTPAPIDDGPTEEELMMIRKREDIKRRSQREAEEKERQ